MSSASVKNKLKLKQLHTETLVSTGNKVETVCL